MDIEIIAIILAVSGLISTLGLVQYFRSIESRFHRLEMNLWNLEGRIWRLEHQLKKENNQDGK